jgi:hypothetical protein
MGLIDESVCRLAGWLEESDYSGYDPFDGLSASLLRKLTFNNKYLRIALQQGVRRFPLNLRPLLGIPESHSTKGMGFLARGFMRLNRATGGAEWNDRAVTALQWLMNNQSQGYAGACWGNHFDYQSRNSYACRGLPSVVWTSLIGHAFLDAFEHFHNRTYLEVADTSCVHILRDLAAFPDGDSFCIGYFPGDPVQIHNANTLGASLLSRTYSFTGNSSYLELATKAMSYTAKYQRENGSWYYGEASNLHWVDNFHTGYVLDCFKRYSQSTGDRQFDDAFMKGYRYWKETFFLADGTPRYYDFKTLPLDIQCCSQAIDTLVYFHDLDPDSVPLALKVAKWTIANMQDRSGYFYYRRYSRRIINKTPTLHWGQATMLCALAGLYKLL